MTFVEMCIAGISRPDQVDDFVDDWHNDTDPGQGIELREALGLSKEEYAGWMRGTITIEDVITYLKGKP